MSGILIGSWIVLMVSQIVSFAQNTFPNNVADDVGVCQLKHDGDIDQLLDIMKPIRELKHAMEEAMKQNQSTALELMTAELREMRTEMNVARAEIKLERTKDEAFKRNQSEAMIRLEAELMEMKVTMHSFQTRMDFKNSTDETWKQNQAKTNELIATELKELLLLLLLLLL